MSRQLQRDRVFLDSAVLLSTLSRDHDSQHGCIIVDAEHRIVSGGYNGPLMGVDDSTVPTDRPTKYGHMVHAEQNAVIFARGGLVGCAAYVTAYPCPTCMMSLLQAGIARIVCGWRVTAAYTFEDHKANLWNVKQKRARWERFFDGETGPVDTELPPRK